jgi:hypothetical protein
MKTDTTKTFSEKAKEVSANLIAHTTSVHNVGVIKTALEEAYIQGRLDANDFKN